MNGMANNGVVNSGAVNEGMVNNGLVNSGAVNEGMVNNGVVNSGAVNEGMVNNGVVNSGTVNEGMVNNGLVNSGIVNDGAGGEAIVSRSRQGTLPLRTRRGAWFVIAASFVGCAAGVGLRGGAVEWFGLCLSGSLIGFSGLLPWLASLGISGERSLEHNVMSAGGSIRVSWLIRRAVRVPMVWMVIEDGVVNGSSNHRHPIRYRRALLPARRQTVAFDYRLHALARGVYRFAPLTVAVGDWLGLTTIYRTVEEKSGETAHDQTDSWIRNGSADDTALVVLPAELAAGSGNGEASGDASWRRATAGSEGAERGTGKGELDNNNALRPREGGIGPDSRPYREGDSWRDIDFRAAARGRGLHTKVHERQRPQSITIAIDDSSEAYLEKESLFDEVISHAAYKAIRYAEQGGKAVVVAGNQVHELPTTGDSRYKEARGRLLAMLARLRCGNAQKQDAIDSLAALWAEETRPGGMIHIYSGDWKRMGKWETVGRALSEQGCGAKLYLTADSKLASFARRERQKRLMDLGMAVTWLPMANRAALSASSEGGEAYVLP